MEVVNIAEFARRTGRTKQTIDALVKSGKITAVKTGGRWAINYEQGLADLNNNVLNPQRPLPETGSGSGSPGPEPINERENLLTLKRARLQFQVKKEKLLYEQLAGSLVSKQEIDDQLFRKGVLIRQTFQRIPGQIIDDLLSAADRTDALRIFSEAIDAALIEVANTLEQ